MRIQILIPLLGLLSAASAQQRPEPTPPNHAAPNHDAAHQDPRSASALTGQDDILPIHSLDPDPDGDPIGTYGIWAAGAKYKVAFHDDMTFVPYLGSDYPHNQPLAWRTTSVRAGGKELLSAGEVPSRQQEQFQYRYRYQRFVEVYDVLAAGVEQSFVIHEPTGGDDLVIEGQVTTALHGATVGAAHQEIRFFDDDQNLVTTYGAAWAIDALGRKTDVSSSFAEGRIRLTVDGDWMAGAAFPVVVDPILTPTLLSWGTLRESLDVCRDDSDDARMTAMLRTASATDNDVYAQIRADDYSTNDIVFTDITASWSHDQVRVATADSPQKYVVVFDRFFPNNGSRALRLHAHDSGDLTLSTTVEFLPSTTGTWDWRADVGGTTRTITGEEVLIVYQHDAAVNNTATSEIWGMVVDISGATPVIGTKFEISGPSGVLDRERPNVNKRSRGGSPSEWMTVFQVFNNSVAGDDWDAIGKLVASDETVSASLWRPKNMSAGGHHQLGPVVGGAEGRYCVAYAPGDQTVITTKTTAINGTAVATERVDWSDINGQPTKYDEHVLWSGQGNPRCVVGDIDYDDRSASFWAVMSRSDLANSGSGNVFINRVGYNGMHLDSEVLYAAAPNYNGDCGGVVFDDDANEWAAVWVQNDTTASATTTSRAHQVFGTSYTYPTAAAPTTSGQGCSPALLSLTPPQGEQPQQIGNEFTAIRVNNAPPSALHFIGVSFTPMNQPIGIPPIVAGCRQLISTTNGWLGWFPPVLGSSGTVGFPLPEWLPPMTLHFQDWYIDTLTATVHGTRRLTVDFVK